MAGEHQSYTPFDEQAARERLERLRLDVEQSRKRRKDLSDQFDAFVSSFKDPGRTASTFPPPIPAPEVHPSVRTYGEAQAPYPVRPKTLRKPVPKTGAIVGAAAMLAVGLMATRTWRSSAPDHSPAASSPTPTPRGAAPNAAAPAVVQPIPGMVQGELIAVRRVWIRATVDGARVVERELQANERVTLGPARTLSIRAGDAGSLRIVIDGRDRGLFGANGIALTRTFNGAASTAR
jgi:hypothetical protein